MVVTNAVKLSTRLCPPHGQRSNVEQDSHLLVPLSMLFPQAIVVVTLVVVVVVVVVAVVVVVTVVIGGLGCCGEVCCTFAVGCAK